LGERSFVKYRHRLKCIENCCAFEGRTAGDRVETHCVPAELSASLGDVERDRQCSTAELVNEIAVSLWNSRYQSDCQSKEFGRGAVDIEALEAKHDGFFGALVFRVRTWACPGLVDTRFQIARSNSIGLR